jgi:Holliday junction DNA helicase RuvA
VGDTRFCCYDGDFSLLLGVEHMIAFLEGRILVVGDQTVVLNVNGVGYEVFVGPTSNFGHLNLGDPMSLWIYTHVREDQLALFGFQEQLNKRIFTTVLAVSGVGPKLAMALATTLSPESLTQAIVHGDLKVLTTVSGVGKRLAERLIVELKDKMLPVSSGGGGLTAATPTAEDRLWHDLNVALSGLGFPDQKIRNVLKLARTEFGKNPPEINTLLKYALQKIRDC